MGWREENPSSGSGLAGGFGGVEEHRVWTSGPQGVKAGLAGMGIQVATCRPVLISLSSGIVN